jgi:hypothetical protein
MRTLRVVGFTWVLVDCGALLGWFLGRAFGRQQLFLFGVALGTLAIMLAIRLMVHFGWLNPERRRGGSIGALCAFALAAPIAAMNMESALVPFLVFGFVGVGVIAGAGPSAVQ